MYFLVNKEHCVTSPYFFACNISLSELMIKIFSDFANFFARQRITSSPSALSDFTILNGVYFFKISRTESISENTSLYLIGDFSRNAFLEFL